MSISALRSSPIVIPYDTVKFFASFIPKEELENLFFINDILDCYKLGTKLDKTYCDGDFEVEVKMDFENKTHSVRYEPEDRHIYLPDIIDEKGAVCVAQRGRYKEIRS